VPDPDAQAQPDWRAQRAEAAESHARALQRTRAAETRRARALIAGFLDEVRHRGLQPEPLRATDGRRRYRTGLSGWYLRRNQTAAVTEDGAFYLLGVPTSLIALATGVTLRPSEPPLVLGAGARDGESVDLADALARVLAQHDSGP
jgi:hypothetical protein